MMKIDYAGLRKLEDELAYSDGSGIVPQALDEMVRMDSERVRKCCGLSATLWHGEMNALDRQDTLDIILRTMSNNVVSLSGNLAFRMDNDQRRHTDRGTISGYCPAVRLYALRPRELSDWVLDDILLVRERWVRVTEANPGQLIPVPDVQSLSTIIGDDGMLTVLMGQDSAARIISSIRRYGDVHLWQVAPGWGNCLCISPVSWVTSVTVHSDLGFAGDHWIRRENLATWC